MPGKIIDITGEKHNRLTVIKYSHSDKRRASFWLCECDCGNEVVVEGSKIRNNKSKSCGCLQKESVTKHGMNKTKTYRAWANMLDRCLNKNCKHYKDYGGRGITVCNKWLHFDLFYQDMGEAPGNHSIDRINNSKGYYKNNCRWATKQEQDNNRRSNNLITYNCKTQTLTQWSTELKINRSTLESRLYSMKWSIEKSFTTTIKRRSDNAVI